MSFPCLTGLDGRYVVDSTNQNQENNNDNRILEKVLFTPIIIKGKVKSKLETSHYVEVNIKVTKIYKGKHQKLRHNFIRLKFEKSQWREDTKAPQQVIKLGMNLIIYLSSQWKPIGMPNVFSRKLKRIITKYGCQDCGKLELSFKIFGKTFQKKKFASQKIMLKLIIFMK